VAILLSGNNPGQVSHAHDIYQAHNLLLCCCENNHSMAESNASLNSLAADCLETWIFSVCMCFERVE